MNDIIERVARAMYPGWFTSDGSPPVVNNYPDQHLEMQANARRLARAAVEAMRDQPEQPTMRGGSEYRCQHWSALAAVEEGRRGLPTVNRTDREQAAWIRAGLLAPRDSMTFENAVHDVKAYLDGKANEQ